MLMATPDPDISARLLKDFMRRGKRMFFARIGDGAVECISRKWRHPFTADRERYTPALSDAMLLAIAALRGGKETVIWGDWRTAVGGSAPTYVADWCELVNVPACQLLHYEALLLNRDSDDLVAFYRAVKSDPRHKLIVGAPWNEPAGKMLEAQYLSVRTEDLFEGVADLVVQLKRIRPEMILFGAGMAGLVAVVRYWQYHRFCTCIHLGSALDPLFRSKATRGGQLSHTAARRLMMEFL